MHVIYDFGMNNGDNIDYYLLKGAKVIGVEANSALCEEVRKRFANEIDEGRLVVLNCALVDSETDQTVTFYLHKSVHVLGQLPEPPPDSQQHYYAVQVAGRTPASIIQEFGDPLYVKVDVEHFDQNVLRNLFGAGIFPPEISAESHSVEVFALLVANGYTAFNLVDGASVPKVYANAMVGTDSGKVPFSFKIHSAGPFGKDIVTPWEDADTFLYTLAGAFLGWKDIHASRTIRPVPRVSNKVILRRQLNGIYRKIVGGVRARISRT